MVYLPYLIREMSFYSHQISGILFCSDLYELNLELKITNIEIFFNIDVNKCVCIYKNNTVMRQGLKIMSSEN